MMTTIISCAGPRTEYADTVSSHLLAGVFRPEKTFFPTHFQLTLLGIDLQIIYQLFILDADFKYYLHTVQVAWEPNLYHPEQDKLEDPATSQHQLSDQIDVPLNAVLFMTANLRLYIFNVSTL